MAVKTRVVASPQADSCLSLPDLQALRSDRMQWLVRRFVRLSSRWGEGGSAAGDQPLTIFPSDGSSKAIALFTKPINFPKVRPLDHPENVTVFIKSGWFNLEAIHMLASLAKRQKCTPYFIGDLDPFDLFSFIQTSWELRKYRVRLSYRGIADDWLRLCSNFGSPRGKLTPEMSLPTISMHETEKQLMRLLIDWTPSLRNVLGARSTTLVLAGRKLELEGASNPQLYKRGFSSRLAKLLWRTA